MPSGVLAILANSASIVLWMVALATGLLVLDVDRDLLARSGLATASSAFVAYGLREVLRVWGGGYYCCSHAYYATVGLAITGLGWVGLLAVIRGPLLDVD